jgi:hypothetical protein
MFRAGRIHPRPARAFSFPLESSMKPINLRTRFGARYVVKFEESRSTERDPWPYIIPAKCGHFYPFGASEIAASIDGHPKLTKRLCRIEGVRLHQDGDDGATVVFDAALFPDVAAVMKPIRRRARQKVRG